MSADSFLKRLDKVGEALSNRPAVYRRGVDDFDTARRVAFIIGRSQRPGATVQEVEQAHAIAASLGYADIPSSKQMTHPFDFG